MPTDDTLIQRLALAAHTYGRTKADVAKIRFTIVPALADMPDLANAWEVELAIECLGEITDNIPRPSATFAWKGVGDTLPEALGAVGKDLQGHIQWERDRLDEQSLQLNMAHRELSTTLSDLWPTQDPQGPPDESTS